MKIVVIGGTGLIGSKTVAILRQGGHASTTEPAKLLAVFVADTDDQALTTPAE